MMFSSFQVCNSDKAHFYLTRLQFPSKAGFGYGTSVSLQTDDAGHVDAAVLAHVTFIVGLQTNDVCRN